MAVRKRDRRMSKDGGDKTGSATAIEGAVAYMDVGEEREQDAEALPRVGVQQRSAGAKLPV